MGIQQSVTFKLDLAQIQDSWTETTENTWTLRTKHVGCQLLGHCLTSQNVPANGYCEYLSIIISSDIQYTYCHLKKDTDQFLTAKLNEKIIAEVF
jgi:hypothetical protein